MGKRRAKTGVEDSVDAKRQRLRADTVAGLIASSERQQSTLDALTKLFDDAKGLPTDQAESGLYDLKQQASDLIREANQTLDDFARLGSINSPQQMGAALATDHCIAAAANLLADIERELQAIAITRAVNRKPESVRPAEGSLFLRGDAETVLRVVFDESPTANPPRKLRSLIARGLKPWWSITTPAASGRAPWEVRFCEPADDSKREALREKHSAESRKDETPTSK